MEFYSHYIWESGNGRKGNSSSVVLQHVYVKKHSCMLLCVCDGGRSRPVGKNEPSSVISGYFTERLVEWFHEDYLSVIRRRSGEMETENTIEKILRAELNKIGTELLEYGKQKEIEVILDVKGILLYDNRFWMFDKGNCCGYLFNRRFNRKQMKEIITEKGSSWQIVQGRVQNNIGILLCNNTFGAYLTEEEMVGILYQDDLGDEDIQRRLQEIYKENRQRGGKDMAGAVYLRIE